MHQCWPDNCVFLCTNWFDRNTPLCIRANHITWKRSSVRDLLRPCRWPDFAQTLTQPNNNTLSVFNTYAGWVSTQTNWWCTANRNSPPRPLSPNRGTDFGHPAAVPVARLARPLRVCVGVRVALLQKEHVNQSDLFFVANMHNHHTDTTHQPTTHI